jgi:hypothetical protein
MNTTKTAAGEMQVISEGKSAERGTTMFFGVLPCGRFCVSSRFQWEVRTKSREKAERVFKELCNA